MKIGVDIDGCLNNFQEAMAIILKRDYNVETPKDIYYMVEELKLDKDEFEAFWNKYNPELLELMDVTPGAVDSLKKLHGLGCHLTIITARDYRVAEMTEAWLKKHQIPYDEIFFAAERKHEVCKWQKINFMIEDNPCYAENLAKDNIEVALYARPYNCKIEHCNIQTVKDWDDIYNVVYKKLLDKF